MGYIYHISWLAGFLNHLQYVSLLEGISTKICSPTKTIREWPTSKMAQTFKEFVPPNSPGNSRKPDASGDPYQRALLKRLASYFLAEKWHWDGGGYTLRFPSFKFLLSGRFLKSVFLQAFLKGVVGNVWNFVVPIFFLFFCWKKGGLSFGGFPPNSNICSTATLGPPCPHQPLPWIEFPP